MLTAIREGSKGWISGIIIGAIVLTFALFGISSYLEGGEEIPVATVNGEEIDNYVYQNQVALQRQNMLSRFGGSFDPSLLDSLGIKDQVLNGLIENRLLDQYTRSENYRMTDRQLAVALQSNPQFQSEGRFDPELYQRIIASNGMSPQGYEEAERRASLTRQLQEAISGSSFTIDNELSRLVSLQDQTRDVRYAVIPADKYIDEFEFGDEEAKKYYDDNIDSFQNPARMRVEYIDLNLETMAAGITPSEDEITQTYERMKGRLTQPEVRKASHILLTVDSDADDAGKQEIKERAEALLAEVNAGADFAELAKENSEDTGSAINGGDLGIVARDQMVKPFEDAVFSMTEGEVTGPIETQFGFHLIKLTELTPIRQKTLDEVRDEVTTEAARGLAEAAFADLIDPLENLVFEQPESLTAAADETGLPIQTSDWFTEHSGEGVAAEAAVRRAAFSADVKEDDLNSPVVELGFERMVALRKLEFEDANPKPYDEVKESIVNILKLEQSKAKLASTAPGLLEGLTHLPSWDIMLAKNEIPNETLAPKKSDIEPALSELTQEVYRVQMEEEGKPTYGHVVFSNGDVALYALNSIVLGSGDTADEQVAQQVSQQLSARDGTELYLKFVNVLRSNAEIQIDEDQL
ncbi:MAG: SurA N-terminal domain-containing protein [Acidiferrobacterales bacterium]|nr:SurA N-terminal domain-containing protein [Acidiferrobacterales bacterium]